MSTTRPGGLRCRGIRLGPLFLERWQGDRIVELTQAELCATALEHDPQTGVVTFPGRIRYVIVEADAMRGVWTLQRKD